MKNNKNKLIPVEGCFVKYNENYGIVKKRNHDMLKIQLFTVTPSKPIRLNFNEVVNGFMPDMDVEYVSPTNTEKSLGRGVVCLTRELGKKEQVLVFFPSTGEKHWLPYEILRFVNAAKFSFLKNKIQLGNQAEKFRLKALAHIIETWNENTGAFAQMDIDPLPHQINLVHHILAQGNLNWLIADDVGLGKTIETGMLLKALSQRGQARRVLLITPAGLVQQWKDELYYKFGFTHFRIYGEDFKINRSREWGMYNYVIGSIDKLKDEKHLELLLKADIWDLIIIDEAHKLSRRQYGLKFDISKRFSLASCLRKKTDSIILLTATPHQGKHDKFVSLLELLRPDLKEQISQLKINPEILQNIVFRNNKENVTDSKGNLIFKGKEVFSHTVNIDYQYKQFDNDLKNYFLKGYNIANSLGFSGNAIGFVMTTYRKLASSSIKAINIALKRRRDRLNFKLSQNLNQTACLNKELNFFYETEEFLQAQGKVFFSGEKFLLDDLIEKSESLILIDRKLEEFKEILLGKILAENPNEKILIFTEYCSTQFYIKEALVAKYGERKVDLINGSIKYKDRLIAINNFEDNGQFLISTEAGGEGINLQHSCHIMINYDLPWNPMRLVQRIGRLYRYGQQKKVLVFNMHSAGTFDENIIGIMYEKINQIVADLAGVGNEFNENLCDQILGEIGEVLDIENVLKNSIYQKNAQTEASILAAMQKAKEACKKQRELFEYATCSDKIKKADEFIPTMDHVRSFVDGMLKHLNIEVVEKTHKGLVWVVKLNENLTRIFNIKKRKKSLTLDRNLANHNSTLEMLDLDNYFMKYLLNEAKKYEFAGEYAIVKYERQEPGVLCAGYLRWQNCLGIRQKKELVFWFVDKKGTVSVNPCFLNDLLLNSLRSTKKIQEKEIDKMIIKKVEEEADSRLEKSSTKFLHPESIQIISSAWLV